MTTITTKRIGSYIALGSTEIAGKGFEAVDRFLRKHERHLDQLQEMGRVFWVIEPRRLPAFTDYAKRNGFEVA